MDDKATQDPIAFADRLMARLLATAEDGGPALAEWLVGCYLHGSAVLGGWNSVRSDVDLLLVASQWSPDLSEAVNAVLTSAAGTCPGRGLECSVVHVDAARNPKAPWPFLLHVTSTEGAEVRVVDGRTVPGDEDLLMHYVVTRAHGRVVFGASAADTVAEVPRGAVLGYLRDELGWALQHGSEPYAVLNALRAMRYVRDGSLLSKVHAGVAALDDDTLPEGLIRRVLAAQRGEEEPVALSAEAVDVVRRALTELV